MNPFTHRDIHAPVNISGVPSSVPEVKARTFESRVNTAVRKLMQETGLESLEIHVNVGHTTRPASPQAAPSSEASADHELTTEKRALRYVAAHPAYTFDLLVTPPEVTEQINIALDTIRLQPLVFDIWGLRQIEPFPRSALNFHGPAGTGKTLAAHAIADKLGKDIICASYAQIESMYHGEGPKNVQALFKAAELADAVLFIDEADSLLSRRLTNVTQGSEQAINSMRSELLICLETFSGIVIFATNLVANYDSAFETRVRHIYFPVPDRSTRLAIWRKHLPKSLPMGDVRLDRLAELSDGFVGREIKKSVIDAAVMAAREGKHELSESHFTRALDAIARARDEVRDKSKASLSSKDEQLIRDALCESDATISESVAFSE